MNSQDSLQEKMNEYLLARIGALETIVMLLWNDHPNRSDIRRSADAIFEIEASNDLASLDGDGPIDIRAQAKKAVFERVFAELLSESEQSALRSLQERLDKSGS